MNSVYLDSIITIAFWILAIGVFLIVALVMGYRMNKQEAREKELAQHSVTVEVD